MNEAVSERGVINLARILPFRLGVLEVSPPTRQIARDRKSETLEPRVMQVLVALKEADGAVVTRDELIARCWEGRVVGDNAIQRTISRLRDIAAGLGRGCFRLETVSKVGYRLIAVEPSAAEAINPPPAPRRRWVAVLAATAVAAAIMAFAGWMWWRTPAITSIAVLPAGGSHSAELANDLAGDLAHLLNAGGNAIAFATGPDSSRSSYVLKVAGRGNARTDITLSRAGSSDLVWSASFADTSRDAATARAQIANPVSVVLACALHANSDPGVTDGDFLRLLFAACERLDDDPDEATAILWRRVVAAHPGNARALATLSYLEADLASIGVLHAAALRIAGREHLEKARALNAKLGLTYAAEAILLAPDRFAEQLDVVERGLAVDPDCVTLVLQRSEYLRNVGRLDNALDGARKAVVLTPGSAFARQALISNLAYGGYVQAAKSELETAERIWRGNRALAEVRFRFDIRFGDPLRLIRQIDSGTTLPNSTWFVEQGPERAFLLARAQPTPENIDSAVALALKYAHPPFVSLQSLVALGRKDVAYELLSDPKMALIIREGTEILFRSNMRPFVLDRRFMDFADQIGLVRYWLSSNRWPDFCDDKDLPYNCKAEARRLHPTRT